MCGIILDRVCGELRVMHFVIDEEMHWYEQRSLVFPKLHAGALSSNVAELLNTRLLEHSIEFEQLCTGELDELPLHFSTIEMLHLGEAARQAAEAGNVKLIGDVY